MYFHNRFLDKRHENKSYVWQLPNASAENNSTGFIHGSAKLHYFNVETGRSYCGRWAQLTKNFYTYIEYEEDLPLWEKDYTFKSKECCKTCYKKYTREEKRNVNEKEYK